MLVGMLAGTAAEAACPSGATVTYLANEAFAISGRAGTVLVDALFREGIEPYPTLPDRTRVALESAAAPFERVVWVLVSHRHADHFSPQAVAAHLRANPRARVASTPAVIAARRDLLPAAFAGRLLVAEPPARGPTLVVERAGLRIEAYALSHGEGTDVDNLGLLVELDGTTIPHMGDSEALGDELTETGQHLCAKQSTKTPREGWPRVRYSSPSSTPSRSSSIPMRVPEPHGTQVKVSG